jgi:NAD(P)-dependent dehydrogenase (short-subunit alcohol dehydrogenase family)
MPFHPAIEPGRVAVITGGAGGIGLAAARRFAGMGLRVAIADLNQASLDRAAEAVAAAAPEGKGEVLAVRTDVSKHDDVERFREAVYQRFGEVSVLMNNAGIGNGGGPYDSYSGWQKVLGVNLWGVINGVQAFVPAMLAQKTLGLVINTGSRQGITCPPGDTAYNVSKAGVKVLTEALQHSLRNEEGARLTAHLLVPGFTFTGLTAGGRTELPAGAWTPEQVVEFMLKAISLGDFYILCPDNEVSRELDNKRILWAAGDIVENRPPLSRWHPDYGEAFKAFLDT